MKKALIILGVIVGLLVVALAAGAFYLLSLVSPQNVRAEVERAVEAATGRDLDINGDVSVGLWPVFGVTANDVTLANAPGGVAKHFLEAKQIQVGVAVMPLLERRIEVHEIVLLAPVVALEVDREGKANWIFTPKTPASKPAPGAPPAAAPPLTVHTVRVESGRVSYANAQTGQSHLVDAISADTALAGLDKPMTLNTSAVFNAEDVRLTATFARPQAVLDGGESALEFILDSAPVKTSFKGGVWINTGGLRGDVDASGPSLRRLSAWAGAPLGDGPTLQAFSVQGRFSTNGPRAAFENATLSLDQVKGRGDFVLESAGKRPLISGRLELFGLDLNPYLTVAQPTAGAASVEIASIDVDKAGWDESAMDFSGLGAFNANLELTISGPLKVQRMQVDTLKADLGITDGVLTATMSEMQLYGGVGAGRLALDTRATPMTLANELAVDGVRAEQFLEAMIGFNQLTAPASLRFAFASTGQSQKALLENLRGEGSFKFASGALRGVDFGGVSRTIGNLIDGKLIGANAQTAFDGFAASFRIEKGVAATRDFVLENRDTRLTAQGVIDIGRQTLELRLTPATVFGRGRDGRASTGLPLPFVVKGPWTKPAFEMDLLGGARGSVERRVCGVLGQIPGARGAC